MILGIIVDTEETQYHRGYSLATQYHRTEESAWLLDALLATRILLAAVP